MGLSISKIMNAFECNSTCSIQHELHDSLKDVKIDSLELTQNQIKSINKLICKKIKCRSI
jgi:hypothetical protein